MQNNFSDWIIGTVTRPQISSLPCDEDSPEGDVLSSAPGRDSLTQQSLTTQENVTSL